MCTRSLWLLVIGMTFTQPSPSLPAEIWHQVFNNVDTNSGLQHLWTSGRRVSRMFKDEIEQIFLAKHLQNTRLWFGLTHAFSFAPRAHHFNRTKSHLQNVCLKYKSLANNGQIATFDVDDRLLQSSERKKEALRLLQLERRYCTKLISVYGEINDTSLPHLNVDEHAQHISFDWRGTYTKFFTRNRIATSPIQYGDRVSASTIFCP